MFTAGLNNSPILDIQSWLDKRTDEADSGSFVYDSNYIGSAVSSRIEQTWKRLQELFDSTLSFCNLVGLCPDDVDQRLDYIDLWLDAIFRALEKGLKNDYNRILDCKEELSKESQRYRDLLQQPPLISLDIETCPLLEQYEAVKMEISEYEDIRDKRLLKLKELNYQHLQARRALGLSLPDPFVARNHVPTEDEMKEFAAIMTSRVNEARGKHKQYTTTRELIKTFSEKLEIPDPLNDRAKPDISEKNLSMLQTLQTKLLADYMELDRKFSKLRTNLISTYDRLGIRDFERYAFLEAHSTCRPSSIRSIEFMIARLERGPSQTAISLPLEADANSALNSQAVENQIKCNPITPVSPISSRAVDCEPTLDAPASGHSNSQAAVKTTSEQSQSENLKQHQLSEIQQMDVTPQ